jgi:hypothetical protein
VSELTPYGEGLWIARQPHRFLGLELGARMTVVQLRGGALLVHSPIALGPALRSAIEALGTVQHVVAPNLYHHVYAGEHQKAWPDAMLHAPEGLAKKRPDLRIDRTLGAPAHEDWRGILEPLPVEGSELRETVFHHAPARAIVSCDLTERFLENDSLPTRLYLKSMGVWQKPGIPAILRVIIRDKKAMRRSIDAILERDFDRVIFSHGEPFETGAKDVVRSSYDFLR